MKKEFKHVSVLLNEAVEHLQIVSGSWYVDCTLGGGGHTEKILQKGGKVIGIDQDIEAIEYTSERLAQYIKQGSLVIKKSNFENIDDICEELSIIPSGILLDLGVSSYQFDGNERGFSFQNDEPLDMRMDPENQEITAKEIINTYDKQQLTKIFIKYGEDPLAGAIADGIVVARRSKTIESTTELAEIVGQVYFRAYHSKSKLNPATKAFQALRIEVNNEIGVLKTVLKKSIQLLPNHGRLSVITFHGLEDRVVKQIFMMNSDYGKQVLRKPISPDQTEVAENHRSRSAKLRVFEKLV